MANILDANSSFRKLIANDTTEKVGKLHVAGAYVHQAGVGEPQAVSISDISVKHTIQNVSSTVFAEDKIAINIQSSLQAPYTYNRVYLVNKDDDIIYMFDISELSQSEINEDFIVTLVDAVTITVA